LLGSIDKTSRLFVSSLHPDENVRIKQHLTGIF
jgi:hypothetical protein